MKKLTALLLAGAFLCGCSEAETTESRPEPTTFDIDSFEPGEDIACYESIFYDTEEEFKSSEFCSETMKAGWEIYLPVYEEEKYALESISSDIGFYHYTLYDKEDGELVEYSFYLNGAEPDFEYYRENQVYDFQCVTTAESGGVTYDVLVHATDYNNTLNHAIEYYPFDGYYCVFWSGANASMEEAIEAFGDFTLIPLQ